MSNQDDYQLVRQQIQQQVKHNEQYKQQIHEAALVYRWEFAVRLVERVLGYRDEAAIAFVLA